MAVTQTERNARQEVIGCDPAQRRHGTAQQRRLPAKWYDYQIARAKEKARLLACLPGSAWGTGGHPPLKQRGGQHGKQRH